MTLGLREVVALGKETIDHWLEDKVSALAAALSYYALFSLAPLLLIVVGVAGLVFGTKAAEGELYDQISALIGGDGAAAVQSLMVSMHQRTSGGIVATAVGVLILVFGATGVFAQLQDSLNTIWRAKSPTTNDLLDFLRVRFLSFSMVLGIGFLLLVSLILSAALSTLGAYLGGFFPGWVVLGHLIDNAISIVGITVLFAMIFKVLPDTYVAWRDVWLGALFTSFLFTVGKFAIGFYLGRAGITSGYGAAGSLVILLLWVYYSALIMYFGAEFTHVYSLRRGSRHDSTQAPVSGRPEGRRAEQLIPSPGAPTRS
jgi:membrane protein